MTERGAVHLAGVSHSWRPRPDPHPHPEHLRASVPRRAPRSYYAPPGLEGQPHLGPEKASD